MSRRKEIEDRHYDLLVDILDNHWKGTPEEFGMLLYDATCPLPHGVMYSQEYRQECSDRRVGAIKQIRSLEGGDDLLRLENILKHMR